MIDQWYAYRHTRLCNIYVYIFYATLLTQYFWSYEYFTPEKFLKFIKSPSHVPCMSPVCPPSYCKTILKFDGHATWGVHTGPCIVPEFRVSLEYQTRIRWSVGVSVLHATGVSAFWAQVSSSTPIESKIVWVTLSASERLCKIDAGGGYGLQCSHATYGCGWRDRFGPNKEIHHNV